jgi:translation elongation factor EF-G
VEEAAEPVLEPVLTYRIEFLSQVDALDAYRKLCRLEEEDPQLHMVWNGQTREIHVQVMGEVQIEILKSQIKERFLLDVEFGEGSIIYKETIADTVEGFGHFEPLRHYAEVRLLLEPLTRGSGLQYDSKLSTDLLEGKWQRLILTHLREKEHIGVLTGSKITDIKITLIDGRAHIKHPEGGDFRQATYRAVRQGLKKAKSVLLEPVYAFRLEIPSDKMGRAISDIQKMAGTFSLSEVKSDTAVIVGTAPVSEMRDYQIELTVYTRGEGRLSLTFGGYAECHNADEVISRIAYDSERDTENPTGSIFCSHGAGYAVKWDQAEGIG